MYTIRHVNMQHIHEIFTQLIFLTRRRYGIVDTKISYCGHACTIVLDMDTAFLKIKA